MVPPNDVAHRNAFDSRQNVAQISGLLPSVIRIQDLDRICRISHSLRIRTVLSNNDLGCLFRQTNRLTGVIATMFFGRAGSIRGEGSICIAERHGQSDGQSSTSCYARALGAWVSVS